jgi:hypothetical protein
LFSYPELDDIVVRSASFWIAVGLLFGVGLSLLVVGLYMMYDSGFLLNPSGYVFCSPPLGSNVCAWYQYVYPIKKAEYWIGTYSLISGVVLAAFGAVIGAFGRNRKGTVSKQEYALVSEKETD